MSLLDFELTPALDRIAVMPSDDPEGMNSTNYFWSMRYKDGHPKCRALVASDGEHAILLDWIGPDLDYLNHVDSGTFHHDEWAGTKIGIWIWEGRLRSSRDYWDEHDEWLEGDFRKLTRDEWADYCVNDCPWDPADWGTAWPDPRPDSEGEAVSE